MIKTLLYRLLLSEKMIETLKLRELEKMNGKS
jgi:hypothetical protein